MINYWLRSYLLRLSVGLALCSSVQNIFAQSPDTILLSLPQAEKRFLDSNLSLLAAQYNIDVQKAFTRQAHLWNNPTLNTDQVIAGDGKIFPYGKKVNGITGGQYYIQIQQLISTARKRGKLIELSETNEKISELQLQNILLNLKDVLYNDYYSLVQLTNIAQLYGRQNTQLDVLYNGMNAQFNAGNIALKDLLRIQALSVSLKQDMAENSKAIENIQSELRSLLLYNSNTYILPADTSGENNFSVSLPLETCIDSALANNPVYLLQKQQSVYQQQNLIYQKALSVPDITIGPEFDRNSNFVPNYFGLGISLPIPLLNRNQGNIKAASFQLKQQQATVQNAETVLRNNVINAYNNLLLSLQQNAAFQKSFYTAYNSMFKNMLQSYKQKQISLLEFIDFFDTYKDMQLQLFRQQLNIQLAREALNYATGIALIK